jgi:peptidoglycan/xylan/chitin deacetylase (PgdA/CDA1 family)
VRAIGRLPPSELRKVALTFDDGPQAQTTEVIVDMLVEAQVPATFFVVGEQCELHAGTLEHVIEAGMSVGVHGWSHTALVGYDAPFVIDELQRTIKLLRSARAHTTLFRPPYGKWDRCVVDVARRLGLRTIIWDVPGDDWATRDADAIVERVLTKATDRSIVALHDGGGERRQTIAALPSIITGLRSKGLTFTDLAQQRW